MGSARSRPSPRDRGAAAVEFALVVPLLLALMFGIVDYGLWFGDSLNARQGVDEGARQAVVKNFDDCPGSDPGAQTACVVKNRISAMAGEVFVRVEAENPKNWKKGGQLEVCAVVKVSGLTGLTPMPESGLIVSAVSKRIEKDHDSTVAVHEDPLPAGLTWSGMCS
jgi:hypothetical protein